MVIFSVLCYFARNVTIKSLIIEMSILGSSSSSFSYLEEKFNIFIALDKGIFLIFCLFCENVTINVQE